jgi:hypothetical protein
MDSTRPVGVMFGRWRYSNCWVRVTHLPTGIVCESDKFRSQYRNRSACLLMLRSRIAAQQLDPGPMPVVRDYTEDDLLDRN